MTAGMSPLVEQVREGDRARFLSLLFMPEDKRADVAPLYALSLELGRIPTLVSEPVPGEIRLQWWREVFSGERRSEAAQNPLAAEVLRVVDKYRLPPGPFLNLLEARSFDLYSDPIETVKQLEGYGGETSSSIMQLAALILNEGTQPPTSDMAGYGGVARTITNIMLAAPYTLGRGQTYIPLEILERHGVAPAALHAGQTPEGAGAVVSEMCRLGLDYLARARAEAPPGALLPAFLELATVEPSLRRISRQGASALTAQNTLPKWRTQWHIWRAARRGRI